MSKDGYKNETNIDDAQSQQNDSISVGNHLQRLRIEHGWHIDDISKATKISASNLRAIENTDYASLPAATFTKGLLAIYADYLGADKKQIITQFFLESDENNTESKRSRQKKPSHFLTPITLAEPSHISSASVAGVIFLIIITLFISYCFYTSWNPFSALTSRVNPLQSVLENLFPDRETVNLEVSPQKDTTATVPSKADNSVPKIINQSPVVTPGKNEKKPVKKTLLTVADQKNKKEKPIIELYTLKAYFLQNTWVESTINDLRPVLHSFQKGDRHEWNAKQSLTLIFEDNNSAELQLNGKNIPFPKSENEQLILRVPEVLLDQ